MRPLPERILWRQILVHPPSPESACLPFPKNRRARQTADFSAALPEKCPLCLSGETGATRTLTAISVSREGGRARAMGTWTLVLSSMTRWDAAGRRMFSVRATRRSRTLSRLRAASTGAWCRTLCAGRYGSSTTGDTAHSQSTTGTSSPTASSRSRKCMTMAPRKERN